MKPLTVIKYGGHAMNDTALNDAFAQNIYEAQKNWNIVIGHGGGPQINTLLAQLNIESSFKNGLRKTNAKAMKAVEMALCGDVNTWLVSLLCQAKCQAVGLTGKDACTLLAQKNSDPELGFVGEVCSVNPKLCLMLLENGYVPVFAPIGYEEKTGSSLNINADTATGALAGALQADIFILVTDVAGVLDKEKNLLPHLNFAQLQTLKQNETIYGGMIPKVESCEHAIKMGCKTALIMDGSNAAKLSTILEEMQHALTQNNFSSLDFSTFNYGTLITK